MTFFVVCYVYIVICSGHYNKLLTYLLTYLDSQYFARR